MKKLYFVGAMEIIFGLWIIITGAFIHPLLIGKSIVAEWFFSLATTVSAIYFVSSGVADIGGWAE